MLSNIMSSISYSLFISIRDTMQSIGKGIVKIFKKIFQIIPKTYNKIFEFFEKKGCSPRVSKILAGILTALFVLIIS